MDTNEKLTPDGPIVGDVAAVIRDVLYAQVPIVVNVAMMIDDDAIVDAIVDALAEIVTALNEKALAGGYAIQRNYEAWSKEDLKEPVTPEHILRIIPAPPQVVSGEIPRPNTAKCSSSISTRSVSTPSTTAPTMPLTCAASETPPTQHA